MCGDPPQLLAPGKGQDSRAAWLLGGSRKTDRGKYYRLPPWPRESEEQWINYSPVDSDGREVTSVVRGTSQTPEDGRRAAEGLAVKTKTLGGTEEKIGPKKLS